MVGLDLVQEGEKLISTPVGVLEGESSNTTMSVSVCIVKLPNIRQAQGHRWGCSKKIITPKIGSTRIPYLDQIDITKSFQSRHWSFKYFPQTNQSYRSLVKMQLLYYINHFLIKKSSQITSLISKHNLL